MASAKALRPERAWHIQELDGSSWSGLWGLWGRVEKTLGPCRAYECVMLSGYLVCDFKSSHWLVCGVDQAGVRDPREG